MKRIIYLLALLPLLLLWGCNNDDNSAPEVGAPVQFAANIAGQEAIQTRVLGTTWTNGDAIGIFMKKKGGSLPASLEINRKYSSNGSSFTLNDGKSDVYYPPSNNVDFVAYYPYQANFSTPYVYTVDVKDQTLPDLLYSNNATNITKSANAVNLQFKHQLSQVVLTVVKGIGVTDADVQNMAVEFAGMPTTADFDLADGSFKNLSGVSNISLGIERTAIIIPQASNNYTNRKMLFTVAGKTFTYSIPSTEAFVSGSKYSYTVTVTRTGVTVKSSGIVDWEEEIFSRKYHIGDYYPNDQNPIGVVYIVSDGGKHGKIISLDQKTLQWSKKNDITGAINEDNGRVNMYTITSQSNWEEDYPAFEWVHSKNLVATNYNDPDATGIWYLPSRQELETLYYKMDDMNTKLTGSHTTLSPSFYWSSSEDNSFAWRVYFGSGRPSLGSGEPILGNKANTDIVRCFLAF